MYINFIKVITCVLNTENDGRKNHNIKVHKSLNNEEMVKGEKDKTDTKENIHIAYSDFSITPAYIYIHLR